MIIVSGCPRSGTSLMMDCLRGALGDDRIIGTKFPQKDREERKQNNSKQYEINQYMKSKHSNGRSKKDIKDMNPNGFWECRYSVRGIIWHMGIDNICKPEMVCKVVSQGLPATSPDYVDKMIYMIRHPREVAKSQERLRRAPFGDDLNEIGKVHSPEMYIKVTAQAARWLHNYPEVDVHFVNYGDLLKDPDGVLNCVKDFLGEGDFSNHPVEKKLYRSEPEDIENDLWEESDFVYENFNLGNFKKVFQFVSASERKVHTKNLMYPCMRTGAMTSYDQCKICHSDTETMHNLRQTGEDKKIDWKNEPCVFECGYSLDLVPVTVNESIKNNFWDDGTEPIESDYKGCCG